MVKYEWICRDCKLLWDREYKMGKAPERTRCPECNKLCGRNYSVNISFNDDGAGNKGSGAMDFHTVKSRYKKVAKHGLDKTEGDRLMNRLIDETKERMDDDLKNRHYKSYNFNYKNLEKDGKIKKLDTEGQEKRKENIRKHTETAYNIAKNQGKQADVTREKTQK